MTQLGSNRLKLEKLRVLLKKKHFQNEKKYRAILFYICTTRQRFDLVHLIVIPFPILTKIQPGLKFLGWAITECLYGSLGDERNWCPPLLPFRLIPILLSCCPSYFSTRPNSSATDTDTNWRKRIYKMLNPFYKPFFRCPGNAFLVKLNQAGLKENEK